MIENEDYMRMVLAELIKQNIRKNFEDCFLSGNLADTIEIEFDNQNVRVKIPAQTYNIGIFKSKGVIAYDGKGSYAQEVNEYGGFSKKHTNFLMKAVEEALENFNAIFNLEKEKEVFL